MSMEYIAIAGFILAVFGAGVTVGKLVEKIERLDRRKEDEDSMYAKTTANSILQDRRSFS